MSESTAPSARRADATVLKFGGTSVADVAALQRVAGLVRHAQRSTRPIVVVSALAGVTDALLAAADAAASGDAETMRPQLDTLLERHANIAGRLARPEGAKGVQTVLGRASGIGATLQSATTTLGRGGSDYSAALVGAALSAAEIQIWTDVSGVLTADPRVVPGARTIPSLSYAEAAELAYFGAKVPHPKTIQPAMERDIPVRICNSHAPDDPGTVVTARGEMRAGAVKAIAHKTGVTVLQISSTRMLGAYGFLRGLFEVFERHRTVVDVVTTSELSVSLTVDDARSLPDIVAELRCLGTVSVESSRAIVCVVGEGLRTTPVNLTFVVDEARVREAVLRLHEALFERDGVALDPAAAARELAS